MTDKQEFREWLSGQVGFLHEPTAWTAWLAATLKERERNRLEIMGIIQTLATYANQLSDLTSNLTRQHEK
jgi:hypothetical protein